MLLRLLLCADDCGVTMHSGDTSQAMMKQTSCSLYLAKGENYKCILRRKDYGFCSLSCRHPTVVDSTYVPCYGTHNSRRYSELDQKFPYLFGWTSSGYLRNSVDAFLEHLGHSTLVLLSNSCIIQFWLVTRLDVFIVKQINY
jgi:hypothetical protein